MKDVKKQGSIYTYEFFNKLKEKGITLIALVVTIQRFFHMLMDREKDI